MVARGAETPLVLFDLALIVLREKTGQTAEQVRARHANL